MGKQSPLRLLAETILNAVSTIDDTFEKVGLEFPSLNDLFDPADPTAGLMFHPDVKASGDLIYAAAEQLAALVRPPPVVVIETALGFHKSACLGTVSEASVSEILHEAGPQGLHVKDIVKKNGLHPDKLARVLRLLASYHIFTEVAPDVFTNNRLSSALDTGKSTEDLFSKPREEKYRGASGVASILELTTEEHFKTSPYMTDVLRDPETAHTDDNTKTAFNRAFNTQDGFWTWLGKPGQEHRNTRFMMAMDSAQKLDKKGAILQGFPWETLPDGGKVVDVGGNVGSLSMIVAAKYPKLNFVVQDLGHVIGHGAQIWERELPGSVESKRVVFQSHNFFSPQPEKDADVFLLGRIIHDWGSSFAIKILRHLRDAAVVGKTKLVLVDQVLKYACKEGDIAGDIQVPDTPAAPEFLLPNMGRANGITYLLDIQMLTTFNGQERTIGSFVRDASGAGWKITHIYAPHGSLFQHIVAVPV